MNVRAWFRDRTIKKVAKYGIPAALGKFVNAIAGLVTLAILARHLGVAQFGVVAVIRTVVTVVDNYANFNTWQAIIKYGTEAIAADKKDDVRRIIKLAFVIDIATAVLGTLVVVGLSLIIPGRFGWTPHEGLMCTIYALTLLSKVAGTTDGIFRICDAYRAQAIVAGIGAITGTGFVAIAVLLDASFEGCVLALVLGEITSNVAITLTAMWVARQSGYGRWWATSLAGIREAHPGIARFIVATNAQLTVKTTQSELDMIVTGSVLGKEAAGLLRVIKQLGTIPGRIFLPFELVLFTELARCSAANDHAGFRRLLLRAVGIAGLGSLAIWLVAAFGARLLVELVAGPEFIAAAEPFRWYLLAMVVQVCGVTVTRSLIALGRPGTLFLFDAASLAVLIAAAIVTAYYWGLVGLAITILVHKTTQLVWAVAMVFRILRQRELAQQVRGEDVDGAKPVLDQVE